MVVTAFGQNVPKRALINSPLLAGASGCDNARILFNKTYEVMSDVFT